MSLSSACFVHSGQVPRKGEIVSPISKWTYNQNLNNMEKIAFMLFPSLRRRFELQLISQNNLEQSNRELRQRVRKEREDRYEMEKDYRYGEASLISFYEAKLAAKNK